MTTPNGNKSAEQLHTEVSDLEKSLNELKTATISEVERKQKETEVKHKAEKLKGQIEKLAGQEGIDAKLAAERERGALLLKSCADTLSLQRSIGKTSTDKTNNKETSVQKTSSEVNPTTEGTDTQKSDSEDEEKGFFGKAKDWVGEQWDDVRSKEKWQEESGKNLLRTAGFVATGVGAVTLAYKGLKKLFGWGKDEEKKSEDENDKEEEKKSEKGFWDRPFGRFLKGAGAVLGIGSGVYYVGHGLYTGNWHIRDLWDREKGKKMSFEEAMEYCQGTVVNNDKESIAYGMELQYHEDASEIEAYGQKIKIDKNARKIEGLDISFKKYEHLIDAVIAIAYLKKNYSGKCSEDRPFKLGGSLGGNIDIDTGDGSNEVLDGTGSFGKNCEVIGAIINAVYTGGSKSSLQTLLTGDKLDTDNFMHEHIPELDDESGKKALIKYLNGMDCWKAKSQTMDNISESPIKDKVRSCIEEIQKENPELQERGGRRQYDAIQDSVDKNKYTIHTYGRKIVAEITGREGKEEIKLQSISGGYPIIKTNMEKSGLSNLKLPLKEGIYMTCLLGFLLDNKGMIHKGVGYPRFTYTSRGLGINEGIYFNNAETISTDFDTRVLSKEKFESRMPTLFKEENRNKLIEFLNDGIVDANNISIWEKTKE